MLAVTTPMRPNRPHIPSYIINVKERSSDKKDAIRWFPSASTPALSSEVPVVSVRSLSVSASVRGYLGNRAGGRKRKK